MRERLQKSADIEGPTGAGSLRGLHTCRRLARHYLAQMQLPSWTRCAGWVVECLVTRPLVYGQLEQV